jgi:hypothetical protein
MFRLDMALPIVLARCKPLSDPVKSFARAVGVGMLICLLGGANQLLFLLILFGKSLPAGGMIILIWAILLSFLISLPLGMWLLLRTRKRTPVIYLRAFRSDRSARRLRSLLKAALGSQFRLSGIRQPRKRSTLFIRLFTQALTALKYVGSEHFELEAEDHNWMARLLASYAHTRFVFIDVRDVTPHVATEIQLSYLAMGPERCVFIIDPRQTEVEWTRTIRTVLDQRRNSSRHFTWCHILKIGTSTRMHLSRWFVRWLIACRPARQRLATRQLLLPKNTSRKMNGLPVSWKPMVPAHCLVRWDWGS